MSFEKVKSYFATLGMEDRCISFTEPTATVAEAAAVLGVEEGRIAKPCHSFWKENRLLW